MSVFFRNRVALGNIPQMGGIVITAPTPIPLTLTGLNLWLKADAIIGITDGQAVSSWPDSSGNGNHATQVTSGYRPLYKTNIKNGLPVIRFDGTDDFMSIANSVFAGISTEVTIFLINTSAVRAATIFVALTDDGLNRFSLHLPYSDSNIYWDFGNTTTVGRQSSVWGGIAATFYQWTVVSGTGMKIRRTKNELTSKATSSTFTPGTKTLQIGGPSVAWFLGDIAEILIYNRKLTVDETNKIENYLLTKYNM